MNEPPTSLSRRDRLLYSSSSFGGEALSRARSTWLVFYYAPPTDADIDELLPLGVVGVLLFVANLIEALDDPIVGHWSDRTHSRIGRRLPFILGAAPLWALFALLLFTPPSNSGVALTAAYLFVVFELHQLFGTMASGPFESLLPEIARTNRERLSVVGMKVYFGAAGALVGLVGSGLLVDFASFPTMALVMALLGLTFRYIGGVGVWKHAIQSRATAEVSLRESLRLTFDNHYFLLFLPTFVLFSVGLQMMLGVLPFYASAILETDNEGTWVAILSATAIAVQLITVPAYQRYARARSKRRAYRVAMLLGVATFPLLALGGALPALPTEVQTLLLMGLAGLPLAGIFLFPAAITADIVDHDSRVTGMRREASYYGSQNFVEKTAGSFAPLLVSLILLLGDTADDPWGVRLVGPVAGFLVLVGWWIFRGYDLADDVPGSVPIATFDSSAKSDKQG